MSNSNKKMANELYAALEQGTLEQIKSILSTLSVEDINLPNKLGQSALQIAVKNGDEDLVRLLVQRGCDIDGGNFSGQTALFLACWNNKPSMVNLLTALQANLNVQDNRGWTALMISSYNGLVDVVQLLLSKGADPQIEDSVFNSHFGKRPIDRAKDPKIIKMLQDSSDYTSNQKRFSSPQVKSNFMSARAKTPRKSTEERSLSSEKKQKRNSSLQQKVVVEHSFTGVKEQEAVDNLRQLASQLVIHSESVLKQAIDSYMEVAMQKQMALFEQSVWSNILTQFEQRHYVTFNCLVEYLALKLKVGMAHLGIKVPEDLMIDYQQKGSHQFQEGFAQMLAQETQKLQAVVAQLSGRQLQESANLDEQIYQIAQSQAGVTANHAAVRMTESFQGICQRLFDGATQKLTVRMEQQCPQLERQMHERMDGIVERSEKEMKARVEEMVQRCLEEVKDRVNEVDGWIARKDRVRHSNDIIQSNQHPHHQQTSHQHHQPHHQASQSYQASPKFTGDRSSTNLQVVFKKQNNALKEKINLLKSTLSPKNFQ